MPADNIDDSLEQQDIIGFEQGRDHFVCQLGIFHLVQRNQSRSTHPCGGILQSRTGCLGIVDLDQSVDDGVFKHAVTGLLKRLQKRGYGVHTANASERRGRFATDCGFGAAEQSNQLVHCLGVAMGRGAGAGDQANARIGVIEREACCSKSRGRANSCQRPDRITPREHRLSVENFAQRFDGRFTTFGKCVNHAVANRESIVCQEFDQFRTGDILRNSQSSRILRRLLVFPADTINPAEYLRLQAACRTADLEPATRVDHEQTAIGILDHVARVKVRIWGDQKRFVVGAKCRTVTL